MKRVAIVFGGRSVEHEVSVLTALEAIAAIDTSQCVPIPVYIDLHGRWWVGDSLTNRSFYRTFHNQPEGTYSGVFEVELVANANVKGLRRVPISKWLSSSRGFFSGLSRSSTLIPVDVWMPLLHGTFGEDGSIQGLFEMTELPYTGCNVRAASIGMNKPMTKALARLNGVPVLPWEVFCQDEFSAHDPAPIVRRAQHLGPWPLFVKPANLGSSVGVAKAEDPAGLIAALVNVFQVDTDAIVEPCIVGLSEINVSVRRLDDAPVASVVEMPVKRSSSGVLTFDDKYVRFGSKKVVESAGMATMARVIDPPDLPADYKESARAHACTVYDALGCHGVSRVDFILSESSGNLWFNEINTLPGSLAHYLWAASSPSITYTDLLSDMIEEAETRTRNSDRLSREFGFRVLK